MDLQILTTDRLKLEPLVISHSEKLFECFQDPDLYPYIRRDVPNDYDAFRDGIEFLEKRLSRDGTEYWLNWVAVDRNTGAFIGKIEISLHREDLWAYLAYYTFKPHWRQGYAKEACLAVIKHIFSDWKGRKIIIEMDTRNTASVSLARSLGARQVGFKPKAEFFKGSWSDEYVFELLHSNEVYDSSS
jgi:ribosomal-protein-alanine N-acetyltransferase